MKKSTLLFILLICNVLYSFGFEVTREMALNAVSAYRNVASDTASFYCAPTDTVINNSDCRIDSMPTGIAWLTSNTPKWLVFTDEQPLNHAWSHPCHYYYVPRLVDDLENLPIVVFEGNISSVNVHKHFNHTRLC